MSKFLILSLPRSRSAWMSHWLRYAGKVVGHDVAVECGSVADFKSKLSLMDGSCETGAVLGWRLIREQMPECKLVVVLRNLDEVLGSLAKFGIGVDRKEMEARYIMLRMVASLPGVMTITYPQLSDPLICQALWEHCLELPFDWSWWQQFDATRVEVDMRLRLHRLATNYPRLEAMKAEVALAGAKLGGGPCLN